MQRLPSFSSRTISQQTVTSSFVPPTWSELTPLLTASVLLWTTIFVVSVGRAVLYRYFHSKDFRAIVKRAKHGRRAPGLLIRFARAARNLRMLLVRQKYPEAAVAKFFGLPRFIMGVVVCVLYIIDTYMQGIPFHYYIFQLVYGIAITVNLLMAFVYAERPVLFALSLKTIIECLSIPSLLFSSGARWLNFNFLQAYCILVQWGVLEKHDIVMRNNSTLIRLLINLFLQLLTFLFVTSCGVQFFELLGDPGQALRSETFQITWANSVYFAVVTLMTVGYGDFVPYTLLGRMWIVFHIIFAAYLVSRHISLLIDAAKSMRRGGGSYMKSSGTEHIVVTGRVKWEFLQQFVKEFLAETSNLDTRVIVLASNPNWSEEDWNRFVANPFFDHHMMFLEGSALKTDDLSRAHARAARGVFVLADPHRQDPYKEDSDILKAVLTIRNYSGTVPIYALNTLNDSSFQFGIAMEHLDIPGVLHGVESVLPSSRTFLGNSRAPLMNDRDECPPEDSADQHAGISFGSITSPILRSAPDPGPGFSGVLDAGNNNLYSREDEFGGRATSADGVSFQGGIAQVPRRAQHTQKLNKVRKSESLCVQELETVLLAENVFCNGLSTLISNATLRVAPQSNRNDRPWLVEYKLGAECSIQQFRLPEHLDTLLFGKVATVLQDYGLVLLAVRRRVGKDWTLLTMETVLEAGMVSMALSYHDHSVIEKIADHAAKFIREQESTRERLNAERTGSIGDPLRSSAGAAGPVHSLESKDIPTKASSSLAQVSLPTLPDARLEKHPMEVASASTDKDKSASKSLDRSIGVLSGSSSAPKPQSLEDNQQRSKASQKSTITRSLSTTTSRDMKRLKNPFAEDKEGSDSGSEQRSSRQDNVAEKGKRVASVDVGRRPTRRRSMIYKHMDKLPAALRGHVIVCLDGESPLISFEALLRRLWLKRPMNQKQVPVVVIHPRFPKNFARQIGGHQEGLFLLQGNSLSLDTLKQAQYHSARALLIMASESLETIGQGSTDSKTIFTVMTLDSLLSDQDTFVCCVLDAEESLQLLRAPRQARRVGVNLGEHREPELFNYEASPMASLPKRSTSSANLVRSLQSSQFAGTYGVSGRYGTFQSGWSPAPGGSLSFGKTLNRKANRLRQKGMTRSSSMRLDNVDSSDDEDHIGPNLRDIRKLRDQQQHIQERSKEEYYERQRYASGEMMISSLLTALLAREFTDPGYIRLIRQLIGASSGSKGSWIRQVEIPESWTRAEKAIQGRTYRQTSIKLLKMGCIALGLYRSGDAPVREETKSEQWERRATEVVYLEDEEISMLRADADSRSRAARLIDGDFSDRRLGRVGTGHRRQESGAVHAPLLTSNPVSFSDMLKAQDDEFDNLYYICPSTKRRIFFQESANGENVLPYVYCFPEPYSLVAASDALFVLCHPSTVIPLNWGEE